MSCPGLVAPIDPQLPAEAADHAPCAFMDIDLGARAEQSWPLIGVSRQILLTRSRAEFGGTAEAVTGRVVVGVARSGGNEGYIGIDGESLVPVVQVAEARVDLAEYGLRFAGGVLDDSWVVPGEEAWRIPAAGKVITDQNGWMDRSDLAARAAFSVPRLSASLTFSNGEGYRRRERNNGKDVTLVATLRPILDDPYLLSIAALARDGSRGLGSARDHRLGLRVASAGTLGTAGIELDAAFGVDSDPLRTPIALSAWGVFDGESPWYAFIRGDLTEEVPKDASSVWGLGRAGVGRRFGEGVGRISVGLEVGHKGPEAAAIAGSSLSEGWFALYTQIEVRLRGSADLSPEDG
jgi:hypothetical protein